MPVFFEFGVLGPVRVGADGRRLPTGSARQRFVLAELVLDAGRPVSTARLIDALWAEPPPTARAQLHNLVSQCRRRLGPEGRRLIVTGPSGYELRPGRHRLDLAAFRERAERGRHAAAAGDRRTAAAEFAAALSWWRGPALADVTGVAAVADELVAGRRRALHEERHSVAEALLEAWLALGRHDDVLRALPALLAEHPYAERLSEIEMTALAATGHRAEAMAVYRRLRRRLADELGIEPGPALVALHRQLRGGGAPSPQPAVPLAPVVPRQLPAVATAVTGRDGLVGELRAALSGGGSPVAVLVGPGGVGKSTVALRVAHELAAAHTDGQLYADLGGSRARPADPHDVVGRFLRAVGVPGPDVPGERDERLALYRARLAGRRVLVVLDDAADAEQVRPLLPGSAGCRVLITSRSRSAAPPGAGTWTVPVLCPSGSRELLVRLVGVERVDAEPAAATAIAAAVGHLPLAVTIAAARLASRPDVALGEFAARLTDEQRRLDELAVGDLDVRATIGLSYRALDPDLRLVFRRLGLLVAPDWPAWVVETLAGRPARLLDQLVDAHLVEPRGRDAAGQLRFRLHDLVADVARERAEAEDGPEQLTAAARRLLSAWLELATEADERLDHGHVPAVGDTITVPARDAPLDWFEAERSVLVAAVDQACVLDEPELASGLALRLSNFLHLRGCPDDRERTLLAAADSARRRVADTVLARLLDALCSARVERSHHSDLDALVAELIAVARRTGDRRLEARALEHSGLLARRAGRLREAAARFDAAIACVRDTEDRTWAMMLLSRAQVHRLAAEHDPAIALSGTALTVLRRSRGRLSRLALGLTIRGGVLLDAGRLDDAERAYTEAIAITRDLGHDAGTAIVDCCLGQVDVRRGRWRAAAARLARSLRFQRAHGALDDLAEVHDTLGDLAIRQGMPAAAIAPLRRSLALWRRVDSPLDAARAQACLAWASAAVGDEDAAAEHDRGWRAILTGLDLDEACLRLSLPPVPRRG